jgi:hypothetical protein
MKKILIGVISVTVLSLAFAVPAFADQPQGTSDWDVGPVIGGPENPTIKPTSATVTIPPIVPSIQGTELDPDPGDVFWPPD